VSVSALWSAAACRRQISVRTIDGNDGVGMNSAYSRLIRISRRSGAADWMRMMRSARGWLSTLKPTRDDLPISASICRSRRLEFGRPQVRQMLENRTGGFDGSARKTLEDGERS